MATNVQSILVTRKHFIDFVSFRRKDPACSRESFKWIGRWARPCWPRAPNRFLLFSRQANDSVKQSAALCLLRLFRTMPEAMTYADWASRIIHLINDQHIVSTVNSGGISAYFTCLRATYVRFNCFPDSELFVRWMQNHRFGCIKSSKTLESHRYVFFLYHLVHLTVGLS